MGCPARVLPMLEEVEHNSDARNLVKGILDRNEKLMGFGHRIHSAEDPRARVLRTTCEQLGVPRHEVAVTLQQAALVELRECHLDCAIETNVEFWATVILDFARLPANVMPAMFTYGGDLRLVRPHSRAETTRQTRPPFSPLYVGSQERSPKSVNS